MWDQDEINKARAIAQANLTQGALDRYAQQKEAIDNKYKTATGLSGLLSNLTKDIKAVGNTLTTTGAAIASPFVQNMNNTRMNMNREATQSNMDAIAQKYGYANKDDAYEKGDGPDEMWKEFQDAANASRKVQDQISDEYKNNAVIKKVNETKQSQYGADALRSLKALKNVVLPGAGLASGAVDGAVDALADNLERADGTLFDAEAGLSGGKIKSSVDTGIDAGQTLKDMAVGGIAGAAGSAIAGKVGNAKSALGSRLLNNKLATSGIGRGAIAGAAGGAVGGGLGAALNEGDIIGSTIQGAGSGAITGGVMGGVSSGTRKLGTKVTDKLGITDNLRAARSRFMYDPNDPGNGFFNRKEIMQEVETTPQTNELAKIAEKTIQEQQMPTDTEVTQESLTSLAGQLRKRSAEKLLDQYGTVSKPMAKSANAIENVQKVADAGFEKPGDVEDIIGKITGSNGKVTKLTKNLVKSAKPVNTFDGVNELVDNAIANAGLVDSNESSVRKTIEAKLKSLPSRREGSVSYVDDPEDVFNVVKNLEARSAELKGKSGKNYSTTTQDKLDQAKVLDTLSTELKNRIYDNAAPVNTILTSDVATELKSYAPKNKKWANYVDNTIMKAQNIGELRNSVAPFVNMGKIIDDQYINYGTYGQRVGDFSRDAGRAIQTISRIPLAGQAVELAANSNIARRLASKGYRAAANLAGRAQEGQIVSGNRTTTPIETTPLSLTEQNMYGILGARIGENEGLSASNEAVKNREFKTLEDQLSSTIGNAQSYAEPLAQSQYPQSQATLASADTTQTVNQLTIISDAMDSALAAGDITAYNKLATMYKNAYDIYKLQNEGASSGSQTKLTEKQQKANAAESILNQLETMNPDYGYAVRDIPVLNLVNAQGNKYSSTADSLATQLGYMMSGATVTPAEYERIKQQYVPQPWDSEEQRRYKLQQAREVIARYQQGYVE